jgi:hypothetical protein
MNLRFDWKLKCWERRTSYIFFIKKEKKRETSRVEEQQINFYFEHIYICVLKKLQFFIFLFLN